jgi:SAM-dependent methyltransferase
MTLLDVREGLSVLDVGCGAGYLLGKAAARAGLALGVDLDGDRLRSAREAILYGKRPNYGFVAFAVADGQHLPFADASFDRIICTETLEHVLDPRLILEEFARVLKPGGRLAVSVPHHLCEALLCRLIKGYFEFPGGHRRMYAPLRPPAPAGRASSPRDARDRWRRSTDTVVCRVLPCRRRPLDAGWGLAALERWPAPALSRTAP